MGKQLALVALVIGAALTLTACAAVIDNEGFKFGNPADFAQATHIAEMSQLASEATAQAVAFEATRQTADIQSRATAGAMQMQATGTAVAGNAMATATAKAQIADATATAVAWQAPQVANTARAAMVTQWTLAVALGAGVSVAFLMALAFVLMVRTRARIIPRDASGQLPGVLIGGTLTDPQRQIGPSVTMPQGPGLLWNIARAVRYVRTGDVLPLPTTQVQVTDGGATADHLLEAARQAAQVTTAAAIFRPGDPQARKEKIELIVKRDGGRLLGRMPEVKLIDDPTKVAEFRKVLELESGE